MTGDAGVLSDGASDGASNGASDGALFQSLDVTRFRRALTKLHERVGCGRGRIEIKRRGCSDVCVLISKAELESLEQALEILATTAEFKAMCDSLTQLVADTAGPRPAGCDGGGQPGAPHLQA